MGVFVLSVSSAKRVACFEAYRLLVREFSSARVIGVGSGSTVKCFLDICLEKGFFSGREVVVSSYDTLFYLYSRGFKNVVEPLTVSSIDVYIDGADEVSSNLDLVKGRGAALLREKLLALRATERIYVVDYTKYTGKPYLYLKPVPVEIMPWSIPWIYRELCLDNLFKPVLRMARNKDGPVVSDNGLFIVDLEPLKEIVDPEDVDKRLKLIHGVVETGIFPHRELVDRVVIGYPDKALVYRVER